MCKITLAILFLESIANHFHGLTNGYSNTSVRDTGINNRLCSLKSRYTSITRQHYCLKIYYFMVCSLCKSFTKKTGKRQIHWRLVMNVDIRVTQYHKQYRHNTPLSTLTGHVTNIPALLLLSIWLIPTKQLI